jgi:hypothetical protein
MPQGVISCNTPIKAWPPCPSRQLHLNVNLLHSGVYASAWRLPESDPRACFDVGHYVRVAQIAERGRLDTIFLADTPAITDRIDYRSFTSLEPTIVLATVAAATSHIGLIATASTTYNEPYNIARRFATLDLASGGRAGWNAVTTADVAASRNFGLPGVLEHKARYDAPSLLQGRRRDGVRPVRTAAHRRRIFLGRIAPGQSRCRQRKDLDSKAKLICEAD